MNHVRPVVLSGGSGTRLWPLSVETRPKQFLDLFSQGTLFAATLNRAGTIPGSSGAIVVTGLAYADLVTSAVSGQDSDAVVLVEPEPRNTAPAIVAAALVAGPEDVLVILPSDHLIMDSGAFRAAAVEAVALAGSGAIVAFGCVPDRAEVGYGWIQPGESLGAGFKIAQFVEKPDALRAQDLLDQGFLWNSGMFVAMASVILDEVDGTALLDAVVHAVEHREDGVLSGGFLEAPSISFDHEVMERTERGLVLPLDAGWSDIGSWQAVWENGAKDASGNVIVGDSLVIDSKNSLVRSTTKPVAVVGLDDIVVVETDDGVLVIPRDRTQEVRHIPGRFEGNESHP